MNFLPLALRRMISAWRLVVVLFAARAMVLWLAACACRLLLGDLDARPAADVFELAMLVQLDPTLWHQAAALAGLLGLGAVVAWVLAALALQRLFAPRLSMPRQLAHVAAVRGLVLAMFVLVAAGWRYAAIALSPGRSFWIDERALLAAQLGLAVTALALFAVIDAARLYAEVQLDATCGPTLALRRGLTLAAWRQLARTLALSSARWLSWVVLAAAGVYGGLPVQLLCALGQGGLRVFGWAAAKEVERSESFAVQELARGKL